MEKDLSARQRSQRERERERREREKAKMIARIYAWEHCQQYFSAAETAGMKRKVCPGGRGRPRVAEACVPCQRFNVGKNVLFQILILIDAPNCNCSKHTNILSYLGEHCGRVRCGYGSSVTRSADILPMRGDFQAWNADRD